MSETFSQTYFENRYCDDCLCTHFVEVTPRGKEICHGTNFCPGNNPHQTARRSGRGYVVNTRLQPAPLDWLMLEESKLAEERKYQDAAPDF